MAFHSMPEGPGSSGDAAGVYEPASGCVEEMVGRRPGDVSGRWVTRGPAPTEPWWVLVRRWLLLALVVVLLAAGVLTVAGQVSRFVRPAASSGGEDVAVAEAFVGTALVTAVDYLSWDRAGREARRRALVRVAAPGVSIDGWGADGRQLADSPAVLGVVPDSPDAAVVTVRVRVVAFVPDVARVPRQAPSPTQVPTDDGGPNVASVPAAAGSGWVALPARWWDLAVPVARVGGQVVVPGMPALVGSPPGGARLASAAGDSVDSQFGVGTKASVERLMRAYATDDLEFVRSPEAAFRGLPGPVVLRQVADWRPATVPDGEDGSRRQGDVTVVWELPGGGSLRCAYRIELQRLGDRWLLAAVNLAASPRR